MTRAAITEDRWISTSELAEMFGVTKHTVWQWNKTGRGPAPYAIGRVNRYKHSEVLAWAESHRARARRK